MAQKRVVAASSNFTASRTPARQSWLPPPGVSNATVSRANSLAESLAIVAVDWHGGERGERRNVSWGCRRTKDAQLAAVRIASLPS